MQNPVISTLKVLAFGITRDILGQQEVVLPLATPCTVGDLRHYLEEHYPALRKLASLAIAVNNAYADDEQAIIATDEVVLIPPVSGG
ncbi:MAG: MoaD/ThiS family protein [Lewinellaceae bacterium]|nr:MoaD/ThiS family protein [Lewinellaceae bacterium]